MLVAGFTINLLTLLAIVLVGRPGGRRRDRDGGERRAPPPAGRAAAARRRATRRASSVGPIIAMTITLAAVYTPVAIQGGPHGRALPRVRLHAGGGGDRVGRRGAHAVADDELGCCGRRRRARLRGLRVNRRFEGVRAWYARALAWTLRRPRLGAGAVGDRGRADRAASTCSPSKELAPIEDQGVVFGIVQASANSTLDQTKLFAAKVHEVYASFPRRRQHLRDHHPHGRLRGHGHEALERRAARPPRAADGVVRRLAAIPGVRVIPLTPRRCRAAATSRSTSSSPRRPRPSGWSRSRTRSWPRPSPAGCSSSRTPT